MKIISKYKDYYDYLIGIRGVDPKVVLDRREGFAVKVDELKPYFKDKFVVVRLAICGKVYTGMRRWKKWFWGEARMPYLEEKKSWWRGEVQYFIKDNENDSIKLEPQPTDLNDKHECPILLLGVSTRKYNYNYHRIDHSYKVEKYPKLSDLGIQQIYSPEDIFNDIYNWISKRNEKEIVDNRTDAERIQNAGFDKVTSFRNIK